MRDNLLCAIAGLPLAEKAPILDAILGDPSESNETKRSILHGYRLDQPNPKILARLLDSPDIKLRDTAYYAARFADPSSEALRAALEAKAAAEPVDSALSTLCWALVRVADDGTLERLEFVAADPAVRLPLRAMAREACRLIRDRRARGLQK